MPFYKLQDNTLLKGKRIWAPGYTLIEDEWHPEDEPPDGWIWAADDDEARSKLGLPPIEKQNLREVSRFRTRAALLQLGLLDQVDTFVESLDDPLIKLAWQEGTGFSPDDPVIRQMAQAMGLSDEDVEHIFEVARNLELKA